MLKSLKKNKTIWEKIHTKLYIAFAYLNFYNQMNFTEPGMQILKESQKKDIREYN